MNAPATGIVNISGKEYHTVAKRVSDFREQHGDKFGLCTEIIEAGETVVMRALIIGREDNFVVATGTAEERRGAGQINKTSALENAETSAIGRALAAFGIGGTEFASANEVENAIHQQEGQGKGTDQSNVSPPAFPEGPAKNITALKKMQSDLWCAVEDAVDFDAIEEICANEGNREIFKQLASLRNPSHRQLWIGDGEDNPGLRGLIEGRKAELAPPHPVEAG